MKVELEIVTGFLGAGKSALINSLIDETYVKGEKILVVTLEVGNTCISEKKTLEQEVINFRYNYSVELLVDVLINKIREYNPDRVIIEHNCTEKFEELLMKLQSNTLYRFFKLQCIYFIADVSTFKVFSLNMEELLLPCIENSNLLILNNCKKINALDLDECIKILSSLNLNGHIIIANDNSNIKLALQKSNLFTRSKLRTIKCKYRRYLGVKKSNDSI